MVIQVGKQRKREFPTVARGDFEGGGGRLQRWSSALSGFDFSAVLRLDFPMEIHPQVAGFILYCVREEKKWPALYDEMCRVAAEGRYQGLRHSDLRELGLSFGLNRLEETIQIIEAVTDLRIDDTPFDCAS